MILVIRKCTFNSKRFKIPKLLISECQFDNHIFYLDTRKNEKNSHHQKHWIFKIATYSRGSTVIHLVLPLLVIKICQGVSLLGLLLEWKLSRSETFQRFLIQPCCSRTSSPPSRFHVLPKYIHVWQWTGTLSFDIGEREAIGELEEQKSF